MRCVSISEWVKRAHTRLASELGPDPPGEVGLKNPVGVAVIIDVEGKEGPLQMVVAMRPGTGEVYNLGFTVFGEERGKPAANPSFLKQFIGADFEKPFILGKDVDGITGATRTSASVNRAVKEAVSIYHYLEIQEEREEEQ